MNKEGNSLLKKSDIKKMKKQYSVQDGIFYPGKETLISKTLPAGAYTCNVTGTGIPFLSPFEIKGDHIIDISGSITQEVISEVRNYWSNDVSEKFKQYGLVQKRGILLHGIPGSGKSITLNAVAKMAMDELGAVVLFNVNPYHLNTFVEIIREIEPDKKVIVMWEEFEDLLDRSEGMMLSILDGQIQIENILYLATTNYITRVPSRIKNRPSRFARVIEFTAPKADIRREYLKHKLHESDLMHLEPMVKLTEGLVLDQLKDIIVSVCCFGQPLNEAVAKVKEMNDTNSMGMSDYQESHNRNGLEKFVREFERAMRDDSTNQAVTILPIGFKPEETE
jgi:SpoVK/Ycf46/Vps4 family AAA+-type ATPase